MINSIYGSGSSNPYGTSSISNMNFDYRAAQQQVKAAFAANNISSTGSSSSSVTSLKKDSANFLNSYSTDMKNMSNAAESVSGEKLTDTLYGKGGSAEVTPTDENIKAATDQIQKMVDAYNKALTTVNKNTDRGSAVGRQADRMTRLPVAEKSLDVSGTGISVNKDGTLKLDQAKLAATLKGSTEQRSLALDTIGNLAEGIRSDAISGMNESSASLINKDLASIKQEQQNTENPIYMMSMYSRSGSYNMMNMGAIGLLMNTIA